MDFLCFKKFPHDFFPPTNSTHLKDTLGFTLLFTGMEHQRLGKSKRVCEPALIFLVLGILSRNYKTRK